MGKIKVRTGRGTKIVEVDDSGKKWAGEAYRKEQAEKKKKASNRMVHTGRGTSSKRLGDIPEPSEKPSSKGMTRVTGRGTGSRKSSGKN